MSAETYLNHPTFGLLFRVCVVDETSELFATLYAQRLFFVVVTTETGTSFDPISRTDARMLLENRLRTLRRNGHYAEYDVLLQTHKRTFQ
jgi:PII interaction protein X